MQQIRMAPEVPDEIWLYIFKYLTQLDLIKIMPVSKHFNALSHDPVFWKRISCEWIKVINPTCLIKLPIRSASIEFSSMHYGYLALKLFPKLKILRALGDEGSFAYLNEIPNVKKLCLSTCMIKYHEFTPYFHQYTSGPCTFIDLKYIDKLNLTGLGLYDVEFRITEDHKFKICDEVEELEIDAYMLDMNILQKFPNVKKLYVFCWGSDWNETLLKAREKIGQKSIEIHASSFAEPFL